MSPDGTRTPANEEEGDKGRWSPVGEEEGVQMKAVTDCGGRLNSERVGHRRGGVRSAEEGGHRPGRRKEFRGRRIS